MRKFGIYLVIVLSLLNSTITANALVPKPGSKCAKAGATQISKGVKFTCIKKSRNLVWSNGVRINKATSKPTTTATSSPPVSPTPISKPSPTATSTPIPSPSSSPSPTSTATATPTPSPTPTPTPSPTPTSTSTPSPTPSPQISIFLQLKPQLILRNFDLKSCVVEIVNFDSNYEWIINSPIGKISRSGNLISLVNDNEFSGTSISVIARRNGVEDGESIANCVSS